MWVKTGGTEHPSLTLWVQETFSNILSAAARQELRAVTCPGSHRQLQNLLLLIKSYLLVTLMWKKNQQRALEWEGSRKAVTSGFWENLIQDKWWIIRVTDERTQKYFCWHYGTMAGEIWSFSAYLHSCLNQLHLLSYLFQCTTLTPV